MLGDVITGFVSATRSAASSQESGMNGGGARLPGALLIMVTLVVVHRHITVKVGPQDIDPYKSFLGLIVLQMLPLVILKIRIGGCPDPVSLLASFATKTMLMHVCFLTLRIVLYPFSGNSSYHLVQNLLAFFLTQVVLAKAFGFTYSLKRLQQHMDVWLLAGMACLAAIGTEALDIYMDPRWLKKYHALPVICESASNYMELVAFVPAVWMVHRMDTSFVPMDVDTVQARKQAVLFFCFMGSFYFFEDVVQMFVEHRNSPLTMLGLGAHYMLLFDFALFFLHHAFRPAAKGSNNGPVPVKDALKAVPEAIKAAPMVFQGVTEVVTDTFKASAPVPTVPDNYDQDV